MSRGAKGKTGKAGKRDPLVGLGAKEVAPGLYAGPDPGRALSPSEVGLHIRAAAERPDPAKAQPHPGMVPRAASAPATTAPTASVPLKDDGNMPGPGALAAAVATATFAAKAVGEGKTVLCTCNEGKQRGPFMAAMIWLTVQPAAADDVVERVREACGDDALTNPGLLETLRRYVSPKMLSRGTVDVPGVDPAKRSAGRGH